MNTATMSAIDAHEAIQQAANVPAIEVRDSTDLAIGEVSQQGDCYLLRLKSKPSGATTTVANRQLAQGTSQGSRHCVADGPKLFRDPSITDPLIGPVIVAKEPWTLTHPEHAHHRMPAGVFQSGFQLDVAEQERRAVRD